MKKISIILSLLVILFIGYAFTNFREGGMMGKIVPMDGASTVILASKTDTLSTQLSQGAFVFGKLKEGVYTVYVKANPPYKDATIEKVAVKDGATTDLGEIKLQQ
ncbi:carboxypeptidase regulatory-like domain-containing protein [Pedobacter sp. MW01-1-1]|uniref:carboxypeptidase regulatory-like domain-containing protein n=1 Tax=Pedobacter sp. MW01-1-1 TaxID=3383027 RepID=UPI003FF06BAC